MKKPSVYEIAGADVPGAQQAHVTGALAHIRAAWATRMKTVPSGAADPAWKKLPSWGDFFFADSTRPDPLGTSFRAACDSEAVCFLVECPEPRMDELRERSSEHDPREPGSAQPGRPGAGGGPAVWTDDSVEVYLSPANDHYGYWRFVLSSGNTREATYSKVNVYGWKFDIRSQHEKVELPWTHEVRKLKRRWVAYMRIPFESMRLGEDDLASPWGLNVTRLRTPRPLVEARWNQTFSGPHFPLNSGALYLTDGRAPKLHVKRVTFGRPGEWQVKLSENQVTLAAENMTRRPLKAKATVEAVAGKGADARSLGSSRKSFTLGPGGESEITLPFELHYSQRRDNRVRLRIDAIECASGRQRLGGPQKSAAASPLSTCGAPMPGRKRRKAGGGALYRGSYGLGAEGLRTYMDYPRGKVAPNPKPGARDFYAKKVRHVITRLPKFVRRTTADGAPSDFYLEAGDASVAFNLMEAGCLQRIADYIHDLFETDNDRLAGVVHFVNQPAVVNYSFANTRLATWLSPLSLMRLGGGQCCCFSNTVLGVCEKMRCDATGKPYRGWRIAVPGHVMTEVMLGEKVVLLDGSAGKFYYLRDNKRLGSHAELCADLDMVNRAGNGLVTFFKGPETSRGYLTSRTAWPNGAPIE